MPTQAPKMSPLRLARMLVDIYGEQAAEKALGEAPLNLNEAQICGIMRQLHASDN